MRGRVVLLDDEDPGADTTDRELLVAFDLARVDVELVDLRPRRPFAEPFDQRVDRLVGPLGVDQHRAVALVAAPAEDAQLVRPLDRRVTKADALDLATDDDAHSLAFGLGHALVLPEATRPVARGSTRTAGRRRWRRRPSRSPPLRAPSVPDPRRRSRPARRPPARGSSSRRRPRSGGGGGPRSRARRERRS